MPVDVTDKYIRVRVRKPDEFEKDSFRTIDISVEKGIKSVIGKLKTTGKMTNQNFMFALVKGWTVTEAKKWVTDHGYKIKAIIFHKGVIGMNEEKEINKEMQVIKYEAKKRLVYSVVYAPEIVDAHDQFMKVETIERAAHQFMISSRKHDLQHDFVKGVAVPVESFIVREGDRDFVDKNGRALVGAWVLGVKITDEEVWKKVVKGEIKSFSLAGVAKLGEQQEKYSEWYNDRGDYESLWDKK